MNAVSDIYTAALSMPVIQRAELARQLIDSLAQAAEDPPLGASDEELAERLALVASGKFEALDRHEAMRQMRAALAQSSDED